MTAVAARLELTSLGVRLILNIAEALHRPVLDELTDLLAGDGVPATVGVELDLSNLGAVPEVMAEITRTAVTRSPLLCVHAAVVAGPRGGVLAVPGPSGLGKTTLTAALLRTGLRYLSDEVLAVDRVSGAVAGFPRRLALSPDSWQLLALDGPPPAPGTETAMPAASFGSVFRAVPGDWPQQSPRVTDIVLPARRPGPTKLTAGSPGEAVGALLTRSFNHFAEPANSFRTVTNVVRSARIWRAEYQEATDLAARLAELFDQPVAASSK